MRRISFILVSILFFIAGCDFFGKLDDVKFQSDYSLSYNISVTNDSINKTTLLSLNDDEDVQKYENKLKKIRVDSVVLQVVDYSSPASTNSLNGSVLFSDITSNVPLFFGAIQNFPIGEGTELKVIPSSSDLDALQTLLFNQKSVKVYLKGKTAAAANFTLNIYFYLTVEADALK